MEIEFRKDLRHNYMIITEEELLKEAYCIRMLELQALPGVLPMQLRHMDNRDLFYYDITGKQSMYNVYTKASLSYDTLKKLILHLLDIMELAYEYLLPEDDFILRPEHIYMDVVTNAPSLCFLSGYHQDSKKQISNLLEYLMNKVDYNDKEAVLLVYRLYAISKEEGYTFANLYEVLQQRIRADEAVLPNQTEAKLPECENITNDVSKDYIMSLEAEIPAVMEKLEEEAEVFYYPRITYFLTGICGLVGLLIIVLGFTSGVLFNFYGERIEFGKLMGMLLIILCVEGYLMRKLWNKENRLTKMIARNEYIDPRQEYGIEKRKAEDADNKILPRQVDPSQLTRREYELWKGQYDNNQKLSDAMQRKTPAPKEQEVLLEEYNPTCILNEVADQSYKSTVILLKSQDEEQYASINIKEFPFFIGKLRKNVDYCLEKTVISRYHAKISKEEELYFITDLNSTNGTFVNDRMLTTYEKTEIMKGDRIALANLCFVLQMN